MPTPTPQQMRDRYLQAELELLDGKTVSWGSRTLTTEDLAEIRNGRKEWERRVAAQQRRGKPSHSLATFSRY